jgi:hypothetical protein
MIDEMVKNNHRPSWQRASTVSSLSIEDLIGTPREAFVVRL